MICVKNLEKKIGSYSIFSNVNFEVKAGEILAIQGESGVGKSSLLNIVGLLDPKYQGILTISKKVINNQTKKEKQKIIREQISYLFQNYALVHDESVYYNLKLALEYTNLDKKEKESHIATILEEYGLSKLMHQPVYTLSGGEQQRISLIRTLLKPGNIILADEPTGNLDRKNGELIVNFLEKQAQIGKAIILVTHDEKIARRCHQVYRLEKR